MKVVRFSCSVRYFCPVLTKFGISRQIFIKVRNINLHGNPSNGNSAATRGQTDSRIDSHMTKLIVDFRDYANTRNKERS